MNTPRYRKLAELGPIHDLLLSCSPDDEKGEKSITTLAKALDLTHTAIYKWIENKKIPAKWAQQMVELSKGAVTLEDFHVYVYGEVSAVTKPE